MSDDEHKRLPTLPSSYLPAPSPAHVPRAALPSLPSSSGAWLGSRNRIARKDAEFIRQHADVLAAKTTQSTNMKALIDSRIGLAMKIAEFANLPELIEHHYLLGRADRAHERRAQDLRHQHDETQLKIAVAAAQMQLAQYLPISETPAPSPAALSGLTPSDVQKVAQIMPDMKPETIEALVLALGGLLAEKTK